MTCLTAHESELQRTLWDSELGAWMSVKEAMAQQTRHDMIDDTPESQDILISLILSGLCASAFPLAQIGKGIDDIPLPAL